MAERTSIQVTLITPSPGASSAEQVQIDVDGTEMPPRFLEDPTPTRRGRWRLVETDGTGPVYELIRPNPHVNAP